MAFELRIDGAELAKRSIFLGIPMYGGMCCGITARSVIDLGVKCAQRGIGLKLHFLFNESLITRARNYVADEFLRSECSHLMFIDSDIGFNADDVIAMLAMMGDDRDFDVIGGPYPKKSAVYDTLVTTEDGQRKIGDLVKNRYSGNVLTVNETTGKYEWNKVLTHSEFPHNGKQWVRIGRHGRKNITVTHDHECIVIRNPLIPVIERIRAEDTKGFYILRNPVKNEKNSINPLYNSEQMSFLIGTLFGDGSVNKQGYLRFGHSTAQKEYLDLKQYLFGGKLRGPVKSGEYWSEPSYITEGNVVRKIEPEFREYYAYHLDCPRNSQILKLRELFYPEDKKTIKNVIHMLDEKGLAFWYMDDGSSNGNTAEFCTDGFDLDDHKILQSYLKETWEIDVTISNHGSCEHRLYIQTASASKFFELIAQYVPKSMEYKLPVKYRNGTKHQFNNTPLDYAAELVEEVRYVNDGVSRKQYDIGVENNHNYVANDYIISNCIAWEKIKIAVDKGFADKDPQQLNRFVGDFVFNPLGNQREIKVDEPAEVLETGTGFMMIRRRAFELMAKNRPDLAYRPDHVRTANFDGTREIMAYFLDPIDRYYPENDFRKALQEIADGKAGADLAKQILADEPVKAGQYSKRMLSEDYFFCQEVRKAGGKVWLCPWMKLEHQGSHVYGGSLMDIAQLGVSATADPELLRKQREQGKK